MFSAYKCFINLEQLRTRLYRQAAMTDCIRLSIFSIIHFTLTSAQWAAMGEGWGGKDWQKIINLKTNMIKNAF